MTSTYLKPNQKFWAMLNAATQGKAQEVMDQNITALDPGETTGYAHWHPTSQSLELDQILTKEVVPGYHAIRERLLLVGAAPTLICEDYKVYSWKADSHKWAGLHTPQLIGAIKILCDQRGQTLHFAMAQQAKAWATDEKLKMWDLYDPGMKHARDATRHLITWAFFHAHKTL